MKQKERCTCKNQTLYFGSYFCDSAWCRREEDKEWWKKQQRKEGESYENQSKTSSK